MAAIARVEPPPRLPIQVAAGTAGSMRAGAAMTALVAFRDPAGAAGGARTAALVGALPSGVARVRPGLAFGGWSSLTPREARAARQHRAHGGSQTSVAQPGAHSERWRSTTVARRGRRTRAARIASARPLAAEAASGEPGAGA